MKKIDMSLVDGADECIEEVQIDIIMNMLKKLQKAYDAKHFPVKSPHDKVKCQVCGGKYTRRQKSTHDKTNKHLIGINHFFRRVLKS